MQFRHPESYRILSDGRILQDPMGSGVGYVDLGQGGNGGFRILRISSDFQDFHGISKISRISTGFPEFKIPIIFISYIFILFSTMHILSPSLHYMSEI